MTTRIVKRTGFAAAVLVALALAVDAAFSRAASPQGAVDIPLNATALEGIPRVRIDLTQHGATRHELDPSQGAKERLSIKIIDGQLYRAGADTRPLVVTSSPEFTYLSSTEPGRYVRLRRLDDRITYVEHVDMPFGSVTYWGELRIEFAR
jgi:hypothetical protein